MGYSLLTPMGCRAAAAARGLLLTLLIRFAVCCVLAAAVAAAPRRHPQARETDVFDDSDDDVVAAAAELEEEEPMDVDGYDASASSNGEVSLPNITPPDSPVDPLPVVGGGDPSPLSSGSQSPAQRRPDSDRLWDESSGGSRSDLPLLHDPLALSSPPSPFTPSGSSGDVPAALAAMPSHAHSPHSTSDELDIAFAMPDGPARDRLFAAIGRKVDARAAAWAPDPPDHGPATERRTTATQTFMSVPPSAPRWLERAVARHLHDSHRRVRPPPGGQAYVDPLLVHQSHHRHTAGNVVVPGPVAHHAWPPFMAHAHELSQTPLEWDHTRAPSQGRYLVPRGFVGRHVPGRGISWVDLGVAPDVQFTTDDGGVLGGAPALASGFWIRHSSAARRPPS